MGTGGLDLDQPERLAGHVDNALGNAVPRRRRDTRF